MQTYADTRHRFDGFAELYERTRPAAPAQLMELLLHYLGKKPEHVVDLGCGTGLSTVPWCRTAERVTGVECSQEMFSVAVRKSRTGLSFCLRDAADTGLPAGSADLVVCQQAFHWMEPQPVLRETARILRPHGVFAAVDYDWPPVCSWQVEQSYTELLQLASRLEQEAGNAMPLRWPKETHLQEIRNSGLFCFSRELTFSNSECCSAVRLYEMALSQSRVQAALHSAPAAMEAALSDFRRKTDETLPEQFDITFCYHVRLGIRNSDTDCSAAGS